MSLIIPWLAALGIGAIGGYRGRVWIMVFPAALPVVFGALSGSGNSGAGDAIFIGAFVFLVLGLLGALIGSSVKAARDANLRLGINLRGDLAKLTDEQLASHLDRCIADREGLALHAGDRANRWIYGGGIAMPFGRGLLHARFFYRIMGLLYGGPLNGRSLGDLYVLD